MKKFYSLVIIVVLFAVSTTASFAEGNQSPSPRPFFGKLQGVRQQIREKIATNDGQRKTNIVALRKDIVTNFFDIMFKRFQAAEDRLNGIAARIDSRVSKIKSTNPALDLANIDSEISSTKAALADTQTKINTLKSDFDAAIASDTPKERFKTVMTDIGAIKKELESDRKSLSKIIGDIKDLHVGESQSPKP